jgi:hypothetical protein
MFETWNIALIKIINVKHDHEILDINLKFILRKNWDKYYNCFIRNWLRHYATRRKVAGSTPNEVTGFFN